MIFYLYRILVLPIVSFVVNTKFMNELVVRLDEAQHELDKFNLLTTWQEVTQYLKLNMVYLPDPPFGKLTHNFIPKDIVTFLRKGFDCSGSARLIYKRLKKIGLKPKLWLIIDGWRLSSAHLVTTWKEGNICYMSSNTDIYCGETTDELIDMFRYRVIVESGLYTKLRVKRWW